MQPSVPKHKYVFFDQMNFAIIYKSVKSINSHIEQGLSKGFLSYIECDNISIDDKAKGVCKKFNNLINLLYINKPIRRYAMFPNVNEYKYLSYWLLREFNSNDVKFSDISEKFYKNIKNNYNNFFNKDSLKNSVANIQNMNFEDMNILDNLYKNYSEIYAIISSGTENVKESCSQFIEQCNNYFELGNNKCSDNSSDFCKAIHSFKESYENSFKLYGIEDIWDSFKLKESQSKDKISEQKSTELITENEKSNMFTPILAPIIGLVGTSIISYKFTPLGPWLRNTVNKKKEIKNTINRETHGLLNGDENNNININSGPYNVRYHS